MALARVSRGAGRGALHGAKLGNIGLFVLAGLAAAALSRRLWGDAAGLWTAGILAFLPRSVLMTDLLAAENLLAPLFLGYLLACASSWIGGFSAGRAAVLGLWPDSSVSRARASTSSRSSGSSERWPRDSALGGSFGSSS